MVFAALKTAIIRHPILSAGTLIGSRYVIGDILAQFSEYEYKKVTTPPPPLPVQSNIIQLYSGINVSQNERHDSQMDTMVLKNNFTEASWLICIFPSWGSYVFCELDGWPLHLGPPEIRVP